MTKRLTLFFAVLLFWFNGLALAEQRWFQIELIVFTQQAPNSEIFEQTQSELQPVGRYARASSGSKSLQNTYNRLKAAGAYRPFYYQSWRIPVASNSASLPINISGIDKQLKGWLKIQRGQLLQILADIEYRPDGTEEDRLIYRINEKRRVLLNEVHYLDHPVFGAIVKVSPIE